MLSSRKEIKLLSNLLLEKALNPILRDQECDLHAGTPVQRCLCIYFAINFFSTDKKSRFILNWTITEIS